MTADGLTSSSFLYYMCGFRLGVVGGVILRNVSGFCRAAFL